MKKTDLRAVRSRSLLLEAGVSLLAVSPNASLSDIANKAGIGRATLHRHFQNREQLIEELAIESMTKIENALLPIYNKKIPPVKKLIESLRAIIPLADKFKFLQCLYTMTISNKTVKQIYDKQIKRLAILVDEAKKEGKLNQKISTVWIIALIDSITYASWWLISQGNMNPARVTEDAIESLFNGIGRNNT